MRFSRIVFLVIALLLLRAGHSYGGPGKPPVFDPPPFPDDPLPLPDPFDLPFPDDPPVPWDVPFDPINDLPDPIDLPLPPEDPIDDPFDDLPFPDPIDLEDPFPDVPSLLPGDVLGFGAMPVDPGSGPTAAPAANATNVTTKLMPFPMRIPFHPAYSGKRAAPTKRVCDSSNATQLIIPESKKNTVAFVNTCPWGRTATVTVGLHPAGIAGTPDGTFALVTNLGDGTSSGSVSVVNIATHAVARTITFPFAPDGSAVQPNTIAVLPDGSRAYVTSHSCNPGSFVFIIDLASFNIVGNIPVGCFPSSMAVTPDGSQLWVSQRGDSRLDAFDTATNTRVASFNVPFATGIAFNPTGTTAYAAEGFSPGFIDVIDTSTYQRTAQIPVGSLPHVVAVTPSGHHIFVTNGLSNSISQISGVSNTVVRTIKLPNNLQHPTGLVFIH